MTAMAHLYLTVHGEFSDALWAQEKAQFGLRLAFATTAGAPAKGESFTPAENGEAVPTFGTQAGTHGTLTKTWTARIGEVGSPTNMDPSAQIDMAEDVWTFLNATKAMVSVAFRWTHVKFAAIDAAGHTVGTAATYVFTAPLAGTGTGLLPPQNSMAVSMRANIVGRKGRGRIYFPAVIPGNITGSGTIQTGTQDAMRPAFKTLIDALQNMTGWTSHIPVVVVTSAGAAVAVRPVEIRMGDRVDTIKSRRAQVDETYTTLAL